MMRKAIESVSTTNLSRPELQEENVVSYDTIKSESNNSPASATFLHQKFGPSSEAQEIANKITQIGMNFIQGNLFTYSCQFSLEQEQQRLQELLQSESFTDFRNWVESIVPLVMIEDNSNPSEWPENAVCVVVKRDENKLPIRLIIHLESRWIRRSIDIDLIDLEKQSLIIKEYQLDYLEDPTKISDQGDLTKV